MKFTQLKSTPTAENLNDRVAQMFGSKIKLESFTQHIISIEYTQTLHPFGQQPRKHSHKLCIPRCNSAWIPIYG